MTFQITESIILRLKMCQHSVTNIRITEYYSTQDRQIKPDDQEVHCLKCKGRLGKGGALPLVVFSKYIHDRARMHHIHIQSKIPVVATTACFVVTLIASSQQSHSSPLVHTYTKHTCSYANIKIQPLLLFTLVWLSQMEKLQPSKYRY